MAGAGSPAHAHAMPAKFRSDRVEGSPTLNLKRGLLWNLLPEPRRVTVSFRRRQRAAELGPLGSVVLDDLSG